MPNPLTLTTRQREVAALMAEGLTNREIAERLVIEVSTVNQHVRDVLTKLNVSRRSDVIRMAAKAAAFGLAAAEFFERTPVL